MSFDERIRYESFAENRDHIESDWSSVFGDRKNELVIIGQNLEPDQITSELEECLCNSEEIDTWRKNGQFTDSWPIHMD